MSDASRQPQDWRARANSYEAVRTAASPGVALLRFTESTYTAAADLAGWDRAALER